MQSTSDEFLSVLPAGYFWRKALRKAETKEALYQLAHMILEEQEHLEFFVRTHGLIPPRLHQPDLLAREDERQALLALFQPASQTSSLHTPDFQ